MRPRARVRPALAPAAAALLAAAAGCGAPRAGAPPAGPQGAPRFTDVAAASGLAVEGPTFAAAAADFDRDGWPDLAVSAHGAVQLFHNRGGRFEDLAPAIGFGPADTHGLSWLDLDRDGWLDLAVAVGAQRGFGRGANLVFRNHGGSLEADPEAPEVLLDPAGRGRCLVALDLDRDGALEVAVLNLVQEGRWNRIARPAEGGGWLPAAAADCGGLERLEAECLTAVPLGGDGSPTLLAYGGGAGSGRAFRVGSGGALADVTAELGLPAGRGPTVYAVAAGDYDNDGDLDLYLVRGHHVPPAVVALGDGLGFRLVSRAPDHAPEFTFACAGGFTADLVVGNRRRPAAVFLGAAGAHPPALPWTADAGDPALAGEPPAESRTDPPPGLHLWRPAAGAVAVRLVGDGGRITAASGTVRGAGCTPEVLEASEELRRPPPAVPNVLLRNEGGRFEDVTARAGVGDPGSGRDAVFLDADLDGDLDLVVVNGGLAFGQQSDTLYENRGDGTFADVTAAAGIAGPVAGRGATVTALDHDRDGDVDLLVTNGDGPPLGNDGPYVLWRNDTAPAGGWVEVELAGTAGNPFALGARVEARFGGRRLLTARTSANGRFSTGVLPHHFGIGDAGEAEIEVLWPSGRTSRAAARAGERLLLTEPPEPAMPPGGSPAEAAR